MFRLLSLEKLRHNRLVVLRFRQISPCPSFSKRGKYNWSWWARDFFSLVPIFITSPFEKGGFRGISLLRLLWVVTAKDLGLAGR
jgi:hypothetical protein